MELNKRQLDLLSAAMRHARDADHLAGQHADASLDQAWHLAGFGPECARKACLTEDWADKALGHDFDESGEALLEWVVALDPHAWRYRLSGWRDELPGLAAWRPDHRYERTGTVIEAQRDVSGLVSAAMTRVTRVAAELWADGRLKDAQSLGEE